MVEISVSGIYIIAQAEPDLFSPKSLDQGTRLLLESLNKFDYSTALDWGCGWGAIGLYMAKLKPESKVVALDSDIAAVKATKANVAQNHIENLEVVASHSYDELDSEQRFDLIASNPPTHRGREVVDTMIAEAKERLNDGGALVMVVEARLKPWVARQMKKVFGDYRILKRGPKNVVLVARQNPSSLSS
ncbi:class I SAM-dependent methyltransferase [Candidatus Saccharibacteria bacterium]|nr:class I SAM-dependent methyltransferase [Candidatus Saccharibacteria bacterium]